jgi:KAP family P-loop domain/TIR domain
MKISLIPDQAIGEASTRSTDGLGFETYSRILAAAASDTKGPFTIGVFGEWGTGKTSLMRLIERQLSEDQDIVTVWFNAWRYEQEEHPIIPLVGTIVQALEKHKELSQRFGESGRHLIRSLRAIAYGFSAKSKVKVPGFAEVEASFVAKDMIDRDERLTPDPLLDRSLYFGAFNSLEEVKLHENVRVVVLIDDLDRCFPDQAIRLLESIKLVLAQPGFIFILGVARQVVEGYLQHRYTSEYGIKDFKGQLYLDKIVQLPFHIPPSTGRMGDFSQYLLGGQPPALVDELEPVLPVIAEALGGNPRSLIRFVNNILIDYAISSDLPEFAEIGGIPLRFFAVSRCLEHQWPEVFAALVADDELAGEVATWPQDTYADNANGTGASSSVAAQLLADPELRRILTGPQGQEWLTDPILRRASVSFLVTRQRLSPLDSPEAKVRYDVFVSYTRASEESRRDVLQIVEAISKEGIRTFIDDQIQPGESWADTINETLSSAGTLLYCISQDTSSSQWQTRELSVMASRQNIRIIPILLPGSGLEDVPTDLREVQWLDFREGISSEGLNRLIAALRSSGSSRRRTL